jgi:transposase
LGVPVFRQRFGVSVSLAAQERFYRIIRSCCAYVENLREPFEGELECDESMFGAPRKGKRGWGAANKVIIFGILKRNGVVRVFPLPRRSEKRMQDLVRLHTQPGSLYYTDEWRAYTSLAVRGKHVVIRKKGGRPKGRNHINGIEGFWSYAKHWMYPYRGVPKKYFHLYLGEVCYRFNHRQEDLKPLLLMLLKRVDYLTIKEILVRNG